MPIHRRGGSAISRPLHIRLVCFFPWHGAHTCLLIHLVCRAAGLAVAQRAADWVGPSVPSLVKHVLDRIGQEEQQSNQEELAGKQQMHDPPHIVFMHHSSCCLPGLLKALAVAAVAYNAGREGQQKDNNWFSKLMTEPLLRTAARSAAGCRLHAPYTTARHTLCQHHAKYTDCPGTTHSICSSPSHAACMSHAEP